MQVGAEEEVEGAEVVEAVVQELGDGQRVAAAWEEVQPRILQRWLEHRQAQDEVHRSCNTFDRSLDRKNVLRQPETRHYFWQRNNRLIGFLQLRIIQQLLCVECFLGMYTMYFLISHRLIHPSFQLPMHVF